MLSYFPTPYPNECWYSTLCRFYVRSGLWHHRSVQNELYGTQRRVHGRLIPGADCYAVISALPDGLLSVEDVLLKNTLLPYYMRFYTEQRKKAVLEALVAGKAAGITSIDYMTPDGKQGLKFCPICYKEDAEIYGEPYWHREHQIPLVTVCPAHRCKLHLHEVKLSALSDVFLPLTSISIQSDQKPVAEWELSVADTAYTYLTLPYMTGPTVGYSNLSNALASIGVRLDQFQQRVTLSVPKVLQLCTETYGSEVTQRYFSKLTPVILDRICKWTVTSPEKYVLLSVAAHLSPDALFEKEIEVQMDERAKALLKLQGTGIYLKQELARKLNITPARLDSLAKLYGIAPFWKHSVSETRTESIRMMLTKEEKACICYAAMKAGDGQVAVFAREILLKYCRNMD